MRLNRVAFLILMVAGPALLSGCTQKPPSETTRITEPTVTLSPPGPPGFQFLNCTSAFMAMEIPRTLVEPLIPPQFFAYGSAPGTVQVSVDIKDCPRVVGNDTVYGPVSIFRSQAVVEARNHAWRNQGWIGRFQLDFATNSTALAAKMQELGWPAHVATITHESTPLPNNAKTITWHVDSKDYSIRSDYAVDHDAPQWSGGNYHHWYGEREFRRMDSQEVYHVDTVFTGGELVVQGEAKLRRVTVSPAAHWAGDSYDDYSATWALNSTVFK